jgi:hypothetical protein
MGKHAPIKTTLLRELDDLCDVTYREFKDPEELCIDLQRFFDRVAESAAAAPDIGGLRDDVDQACLAFPSSRDGLSLERQEAA